MPQAPVRPAECRESGGIGMIRRNGEKVDVARVGTELAKSGGARQVQPLDKAWSFVIDRFQIRVDDSLSPLMQTHHSPT